MIGTITWHKVLNLADIKPARKPARLSIQIAIFGQIVFGMVSALAPHLALAAQGVDSYDPERIYRPDGSTTHVSGHQDPAPNPTPDPTHSPEITAENFDTVCAPAIAFVKSKLEDSDSISDAKKEFFKLRYQYCQTAATQFDAAERNKIVWPVWTTVASVCMTSCIVDLATGGSSSGVCVGATGVGIFTEMAMVEFNLKKFGESFANDGTELLGGAGSALSAASLAAGLIEDIPTSCGVAAVTTIKAISHGLSVGKNLKEARKNVKEAAKQTSTTPDFTDHGNNPMASGGFGSQSGNGSGPGGNNGGGSDDPNSGASLTGENGGCAGYRLSGSMGSYLSCASSVDNAIPREMFNPNAQKLFHDKTGMEIGEFMKNLTSPEQGLQSLAAIVPPGSQAAYGDLLHSLKQAAEKSMMEESSGVYSGGGASSPSGGGRSGLDVSGLLGQFMNQLLPKEEATKNPATLTGLQKVAAANQRNPASVAESRDLSLFDRVTFRYLFATQSGAVPQLPPVARGGAAPSGGQVK